MSASARRSSWSEVASATLLLFVCLSIAIIGTLIFLFFWVIGGRFTIDGTAQLVTTLAGFIGAPFRILTPLPWHEYIQSLPVPIAASFVEFGVPVVATVFALPRRVKVALWSVWAITSGLDLYTTFTGTGLADADSHPFRQWLALTAWARGVATGLLTFGPEILASALAYIVSLGWKAWTASWRTYDTGSRQAA